MQTNKLTNEEITMVNGHYTGDLDINTGAKLDALKSVGGYLDINSGVKLDSPNLTSIGGNLYINTGAKLDAPNLKSVGGYLYIYIDAKLDAPNLKSVNGKTYNEKASSVKKHHPSCKKSDKTLVYKCSQCGLEEDAE